MMIGSTPTALRVVPRSVGTSRIKVDITGANSMAKVLLARQVGLPSLPHCMGTFTSLGMRL